MIRGLEQPSYRDWLKYLRLLSPETSEGRHEVYKIMHDVERVDREKLFSPSHKTRTQDHPQKLKGGRFRSNQRRYFFIQHMVNLWNSLTQDVVTAANF